MTAKAGDPHPMEDPERQLEKALIDEFLKGRGLDFHTLQALPKDEARRIMVEASRYAAAKLAEVEARAHYVHDIHRHE